MFMPFLLLIPELPGHSLVASPLAEVTSRLAIGQGGCEGDSLDPAETAQEPAVSGVSLDQQALDQGARDVMDHRCAQHGEPARDDGAVARAIAHRRVVRPATEREFPVVLEEAMLKED